MKVSVYIPAYNAAEFLASCIESLLAQTLSPDEILVVDDGSQDASAEVVARYPGVTLIRHGINKGLAAARNTAMRAARNELVASIDADCVADSCWLAELTRNLTDPAIVGVGGKLIEGVKRTTADRWRAVHMPQHWGDSVVSGPRFLFGCNNLFRRSAVLESGGYDERMRTNGEDTDMCRRLQEKKWEFLYVPTAQATHMRRDTTRSILDTYWRWWRFSANAYISGSGFQSMIRYAIFVHLRYNFLGPARMDFEARRWDFLVLDFLVLPYFPYRYFQFWLNSRFAAVTR